MRSIDTILFFSPIVILWWIALWNLFEFAINKITNKKYSKKLIVYVIIVLSVLFIAYKVPDTLEHL